MQVILEIIKLLSTWFILCTSLMKFNKIRIVKNLGVFLLVKVLSGESVISQKSRSSRNLMDERKKGDFFHTFTHLALKGTTTALQLNIYISYKV